MKRVLSLMLAAVMVFTMIPYSAFASEQEGETLLIENGVVDEGYKGPELTVNSEGKESLSMCAPLFSKRVNISVKDDTATLKMYVAFPVPGFSDQGKDGTLKNFAINYKGQEYKGVTDIDSKPLMTPSGTNPLFGVDEKTNITAQVITVELPKEALEEQHLDAKGFVNVVMMSDVDFDLVIKGYNEPTTEEPTPQEPDDETVTKSTGKVKFNADGKTEPSMCSALFDSTVDIERKGENATLKIKVAYPVPAFPEDGKDGTLKSFLVDYKDQQYKGEMDITTKPTFVAKTSNPMFGIKVGDTLEAQIITITLPAAALEEKFLDVTSFVNVVMKNNVMFDMVITEDVAEVPDIEKEEVKVATPQVDGNKATAEIIGTEVKPNESGKIELDAVVKESQETEEKKEVTTAEVSINADTAKAISEANKPVAIKTNVAEVELDKDLAKTIAAAGKPVKLVVSKVESPVDTDKKLDKVFELELRADDKNLDFNGGKATVTVDKVEGTKFAYHVVDGKLMGKCEVTLAEKTMSWTTTHFSTWATSTEDYTIEKESEPTIPDVTPGPTIPSTPSFFLEDGNYYVNIDLWHETKDDASMGGAVLSEYNRALVTVSGGKVTTVEIATAPTKLYGQDTALSGLNVVGSNVNILQTGILDGKTYIARANFQMPDAAMPANGSDVTYAKVDVKAINSPMEENGMGARLKFTWSTATQTSDSSINVAVPEQPTEKPEEAPEFFLEDGNYYVDFDLWSATSNQISMGAGAFSKYSKALITVKDGKVVKVQFATNPIDMMGIRSGIYKMAVDGKEVTILEKGNYVNADKIQQEYIKRGEFKMPEIANPKDADDITFTNVAMYIPGTPMGDKPMDARLRFVWKTATKTIDENIMVEKDELTPEVKPEEKPEVNPEEKPETKPEIVRPKAPSKVASKLATTKGGYNDVVTTWTKVKNATGYSVYYRRPGVTDKWTFLGKTTKTTYTKKDLKSGTKYQFKIVPYVVKNGKTYASKGYRYATVTTLDQVKKPTIKRVNKTQIRISWNNIPGETGYQISKSKKANGVNVIKTVKTTTGKSTVVKTPKNSKYFYKVRAYKTVDGKKVFAPWSNAKVFAK